METSEVSQQLVRFFLAAKSRGNQWATAYELADEAKIAGRTSRMYCLRLVQEGLMNQAALHPAHRYRLSDLAGKRNKAFLQRLEQAAEIFA